VKLSDPIYVTYHDEEWGKPIHDETALFELFSLETQAAGLSWVTILKKREGYRESFGGFCLEHVAAYSSDDISRIIDSGLVIKSRPKIEAIVNNAKLFLEIKKKFGSLDNYFWGKVSFKTIVNDIPDCQAAFCTSVISDSITKELKKQGFKFIGSTTIYAFMQACGMVNDHENECWYKKN
jgi:DNA-3-methyladenine glycosylase I